MFILSGFLVKTISQFNTLKIFIHNLLTILNDAQIVFSCVPVYSILNQFKSIWNYVNLLSMLSLLMLRLPSSQVPTISKRLWTSWWINCEIIHIFPMNPWHSEKGLNPYNQFLWFSFSQNRLPWFWNTSRTPSSGTNCPRCSRWSF